jgi:acyl carrier protein
MTAVTSELDQRIKDVVCRVLELEEHEIGDTSHFRDDLGADSMSAIELLAGLEREFDIEIEQDQMALMIDLQGVRAVVADALAS